MKPIGTNKGTYSSVQTCLYARMCGIGSILGMGAATKKAPNEATKKAMTDADVFVRAARERAAASKEYDTAKAALKAWLDGTPSKVLPDNRTITLATVETAGYSVAPGTKSTLTVSPPPSA
jgi:hypothetical protein